MALAQKIFGGTMTSEIKPASVKVVEDACKWVLDLLRVIEPQRIVDGKDRLFPLAARASFCKEMLPIVEKEEPLHPEVVRILSQF